MKKKKLINTLDGLCKTHHQFNYKWVSFLLLSFIPFFCTAQTEGYKYYGLIDTINQAGFYNIQLSADVNAHLKLDYNDLRIINKDGRWVPHIIGSSPKKVNGTKLNNLPFIITENTIIHTIIIIEPAQKVISNIGLTIKNTAVERLCSLSGSDDKINWFVIDDSILLNPIINEAATDSRLRIDFAPSSYKYFKVIIKNNNKDPFNIKAVLHYTTTDNVIKDKLVFNPAPLIIQKDSGKISYLKINQQQAYHFEVISLKVNGPKFFNRKVALYIPDSSNSSFSNPGSLFQTFNISNSSSLVFKLPLTNAPVFYILIDNEDNLPLTITEVTTAFNYNFITTYLEKGDGYRILMGNSTAERPNYDLNNFDNNIPDTTSTLSIKNIFSFTENKEPALSVTIAGKFKWLLWAAIIIVLIMLLYFTQKMMKEVDKKNK